MPSAFILMTVLGLLAGTPAMAFQERPHGPPPSKSLHLGPPGKWWHEQRFVQLLGLTSSQQHQMDEVFDQSRPSLVEKSAALQKQQTLLEPLLAADQLDDSKIMLQIDQIVQARGALERVNSAMLVGLRKTLTAQQWRTLMADDPHKKD